MGPRTDSAPNKVRDTPPTLFDRQSAQVSIPITGEPKTLIATPSYRIQLKGVICVSQWWEILILWNWGFGFHRVFSSLASIHPFDLWDPSDTFILCSKEQYVGIFCGSLDFPTGFESRSGEILPRVAIIVPLQFVWFFSPACFYSCQDCHLWGWEFVGCCWFFSWRDF